MGSALAGAAALFFGVYYGFTAFYIGYLAGLARLHLRGSRRDRQHPGRGAGRPGHRARSSRSGGQFIGVKWTDVIIFSILIIVLVFRPNGLLGMQTPPQQP